MLDSPLDRTELRDLLGTLATEAADPTLHSLDTASTADIVRAFSDADHSVPRAVARVTDRLVEAIDQTTVRMSAGGRLIYCGAGTAGRLGILDASEAPPTFGTPPELIVGLIAGGERALHTAVENAEDDLSAGQLELQELNLGPLDTVVGISASGRTPYAVGAIRYARSVGALTIGLSCNSGSELGNVAEIPLEVVVGPEVIAGSTRLKAGTAQKLVLNTLSSAVMIRLGKTYGNLMVDLRATNEKLRARSERTLMLATGCDASTAAATLGSVDGSVKAAILVLTGAVAPDQVAALLAAHDGNLRAALHDDDKKRLKNE